MMFTAQTADQVDTVADIAEVLHADPGRFSRAAGMTAAGIVAWEEGHASQAPALLRRAVVSADRHASGAARALPRLALATMLTGAGRFAEADRCIDESRRELAREADARWAGTPAIFDSRVHLATGRLDDAIACASTGVARAAGGGACGFLPLAWLTLAAAALDRDDLTSAAAETARYRDGPPPPRAAVGWATYAWLHARIMDAREGREAAFDALRPVYDDLDAHQRLLLEEPAAAGGLVRLARARGDEARAATVDARATHLAKENADVESLAAAAAHSRGVLTDDVGMLEAAVEGHHHPWARASAAEDAGVVLVKRGERERATELLDRALDGYEGAGAVRDAARVRARLRDLGVRRRHWQREQRPVEGWASLTDTERRVASLVAEGLTNQQTGARMFVSRHTVDFHLRQIFRKLTITSRVELAGIVLAPRSPT
jgi:DNA-binding CsgD family transcriptional regulator